MLTMENVKAMFFFKTENIILKCIFYKKPNCIIEDIELSASNESSIQALTSTDEGNEWTSC